MQNNSYSLVNLNTNQTRLIMTQFPSARRNYRYMVIETRGHDHYTNHAVIVINQWMLRMNNTVSVTKLLTHWLVFYCGTWYTPVQLPIILHTGIYESLNWHFVLKQQEAITCRYERQTNVLAPAPGYSNVQSISCNSNAANMK